MNKHQLLGICVVVALLMMVVSADDESKKDDHVHKEPHVDEEDIVDEKPHVEEEKDKPHQDGDHKNCDKDKDNDHEKGEERPYRKWKHRYVSKYRRPVHLEIRVPFFTMFLKRDQTGPSKLGVKVFPGHHDHYHDHDHDHDHDDQGSLVDIRHRWWKK